MVKLISPHSRAHAFCDAFELRLPILMAPMAGACPASLAIAVANAGGLGGCGALLRSQRRSAPGPRTFARRPMAHSRSIFGSRIRPRGVIPLTRRECVNSLASGGRLLDLKLAMWRQLILRSSARLCWMSDRRSCRRSWASIPRR